MNQLAPRLTPEMRQAATEKALAARRRVAEVKQDLKDGKLSFQDVFDMDDDAVGRMKIVQLLQTLPGVGAKRAEIIMSNAKIAPSRRVRGVGPRQTEVLLETEKKYRGSSGFDSDGE